MCNYRNKKPTNHEIVLQILLFIGVRIFKNVIDLKVECFPSRQINLPLKFAEFFAAI